MSVCLPKKFKILWFCRLLFGFTLPSFAGIFLVADILRKAGLESVEETWRESPKYGEVVWFGLFVESLGGVGARPRAGSNLSLNSCVEFLRGLRNIAWVASHKLSL